MRSSLSLENTAQLGEQNQILAHMVLIERATGKHVGPATAITANDWPFQTPHPSQTVWRYLDDWKFRLLLKQRSLFFSRADRFKDETEGKYAEANRTTLTRVYQDFCANYGISHDHDPFIQNMEIGRSRFFVSCWHINDHESRTMWSKYTKSPDFVVVQSRVGRLCSYLPRTIQIASVNYADQSVARPEWHSSAPIFYKNPEFRFENELRLVIDSDLNETIDFEKDLGRDVFVDPSLIIERVVIHPNARKKYKKEIRKLLNGTPLTVVASSLPR